MHGRTRSGSPSHTDSNVAPEAGKAELRFSIHTEGGGVGVRTLSGPAGSLADGLAKQVAKGGMIGFAGHFMGRGIGILFQLLLTRVLGVDSYGLYALANSVFGITQSVSMLGLHNSLVRFGSMYHSRKEDERVKGVFLTAVVIAVGSSSLLAASVALFAPQISRFVFHKPELSTVLRLFACALPFYTFMTIVAYVAQAFRRIAYFVGIREVLHPLLSLLAVGGSFLLGFRLLGAAGGFLGSSVTAALVGLVILRRLFPEAFKRGNVVLLVGTQLRFAITVFITGFSHMLLTRTDRLMLGALGSSADVGLYNAAALVAAQLVLVLGSLNTIVAPLLSVTNSRGEMSKMKQLLKATTKWSFEVTLLGLLILVLFPKAIMGLFGADFVHGWPVLVVLGLAQFVNASTGPAGYMLTMTGKEKVELINCLTLAAMNIGLNYFLIRRFGLIGAAIATGLSVSLVNIARLVEIYWFHRIHPYKRSFWKPFAAGGVAAGTWLVLSRSIPVPARFWWIGIITVAAIYTVSIILLGLDDETRVVLRAVLGRLRSKRGD